MRAADGIRRQGARSCGYFGRCGQDAPCTAGRDGARPPEHEEAAARLEAERQKYAEPNRRLNARANGIRAVTACEKKESSGRRGRPPGKGAAVNRQFEESEADVRDTADLGACPGCGGELLGVTGEYTRRYERLTVLTERVLCTIRRRYCCKCKKQYTARPKGVAPNARVSANHSALLAWLNVKGLSHGRTAELSSDFLKLRGGVLPATQLYMKIATLIAIYQNTTIQPEPPPDPVAP